MPSLTAPPNGTASRPLDLLALGALVHRLDPGVQPFRAAASFDVHVSGGEYNVAANLARVFGRQTAIATAMVDYPIGELVQARVREAGVAAHYKHFPHDGATGPNIAAVYSDRGHGVRPPIVFYNRANEAAARLQPGDFDWAAIFASGVRWFHTGGIFAALSPTTAQLCLEAVQHARAAGAIVSFDPNFRPKLWQSRGGRDAATTIFRSLAAQADLLFGIDCLGVDAVDWTARHDVPDQAAMDRMLSAVAAAFPNLQAIALGLRAVHSSSNRHAWAAALWQNGQVHYRPPETIDVLDRIGGGDAFAAGVIDGMLAGREPDETLRRGWAAGALAVTYPGDLCLASRTEVEELARGGTAHVQR